VPTLQIKKRRNNQRKRGNTRIFFESLEERLPVSASIIRAVAGSLFLSGGIVNGTQSSGITWTASVAPPLFGAGEITYNQLFAGERVIYEKNPLTGIENQLLKYGTNSLTDFVLDTTFPYGNNPLIQNDYSVSVQTTLVSNDSPGIVLKHVVEDPNNSQQTLFIDKYIFNERYKTYLIYRPDGTDTRWVTLSVINWGWNPSVVYDSTIPLPSPKWKFENSTNTAPDTIPLNPISIATTELPEWSKNITQCGWQ
jgi:hypothetical protein